MTLDDALQTFFAESGELLAEMETGLLELDAGTNPDAIHAVFRSAHTIKGSAGLFGLDHVVAFTHVVENVLDGARAGTLALGPDLIRVLLACRDHIGLLLAAIANGQHAPDAGLQQAGAPLLAHLEAALAPQSGAAAAPAQPAPAPGGGTEAHWHLSLRFAPTVLQNGMDPLSFLRYLGTFGRIGGLVTLVSAVPALDELDPEACYLGFEFVFITRAGRAEIEAAFDFVIDDCRLRVLGPDSLPGAGAEPLDEGPLAAEAARALAVLGVAAQPAGPGVPAAPAAAGVPDLPAQPAEPAQRTAARTAEQSSVRVDAAKLDHLINLVGELIIATASANTVARRAQHPAFQECGATLSALVEEVRNSALQLRMVRIGSTFNRFGRVVHDVALELGKDIGLTVSGEDTELDKTVVEKIADPLTHLVRNAMDHGIEPAEVRAAHGKPARGSIGLHAFHDSGTIVIEVRDDGGGLKRDRILAKALERGLVEPGRTLSDDEVCNLVFEPGFSTAEQVTNLSGRGVGMDVVKRNITAMRGTVAIRSQEGVGTTVTVRLPLTLAIIDGFQVSVGRSVFVIPLDMVEECVEFAAAPGHDYADLRGQVLPFIRLREMFAVRGPQGARRSIVVVKYAGQRAGLVVDGLLGESQTVIKPLGRMFQHLECISGSSILGSGEVALILDVPALIRRAHNSIQAAAA